MENAIKKAIEGGYDVKNQFMSGDSLEEYLKSEKFKKDLYKILLDPLFWQCLGKSLGWGKMFCLICLRKEPELNKCNCRGQVYDVSATWKYHWHRFIDHLTEGKSPDEFFNQLLIKL